MSQWLRALLVLLVMAFVVSLCGCGGGGGSAAGVGSVRTSEAVLYDAYDLGVPAGLDQAEAYAVNNAGQAVGAAWQTGSESVPCVWQGPSDAELLPLLAGETAGTATDIQDDGLVVGTCGRRGVFWQRSSGGWGVTELPVPEGAGSVAVQSVNNAPTPQAAGGYSDEAGPHVCVWSISGDTATLEYDGGAGSGGAWGINDTGELCWVASDGSYASWSANPLPSLGGTDTRALDINNAGQVVGWADLPKGNSHACRWESGSAPVDLGTIGGKYKCSIARAINSSGQIVGWSHLDSSGPLGQAPSTDPQPTLWSDGQIIDLNQALAAPFGALLRRASDINDGGCIVGLAKIDDGSVYGLSHPFLLVPAAAGPNQAPVAQDDGYNVGADSALSVPAPGVLGNDTDPDGDGIQVKSHTEPTSGTLALSADGSFTYTPAPGFTGTASFTYTSWDQELESNAATVTITVGGSFEPGGITGTVSASGAPVKKATVTAYLNGVMEAASTFTSPKGTYTLIGLEPGEYLVVAAKDSLQGSAPATVVSGQTTTGVDISIQ